MTDAEFDVQRDRLTALAGKWLGPLGLLWWHIDIEHSRGPIQVNGEVSLGAMGKADVQWEYHRATLSFNCAMLADYDDDEVEWTFVHECCHILVNQMREWCQTGCLESEAMDRTMKHEESVVSALARAFISVRKAGAGTLELNGTETIKTKCVSS